MTDQFSTEKTWTTFLPLEGITLARELQNVQFGNLGLSRLKSDKCYTAVLAQTNQDHKLNLLCLSHSLSGVPADILRCKKCPVKSKNTTRKHCVCVKTKMNPDEIIDATEVSLDIMRDVTALLRFYLYVSCQGSLPVMNLIDSRNLPTYGIIPSISSSGDIHISSFHPGLRTYTMRIYKKNIDEWRALDFEYVTKIVEDRHLGIAVPEFDETIASSLIWCGEMLAELELKDCFLRGATALETISTGIAKKGNITQQFINLGAALVGVELSPEILDARTVPKPEVKKVFEEAKQLFKNAYRLRCNISHGKSRIGSNPQDEMWMSQRIFVSSCVGAIFVWKKERTKAAFYAKMEEVIRKLSADPIPERTL